VHQDDISIEALRPDLVDDWLAFFDGPAFADNPEWGGCYCRCFLFGAQGYPAWDAACADRRNRATMIAEIRGGRVDGLLARRGGEVVGWLHLGPADRFCTPAGPLPEAEPEQAAIVCFVIDVRHRRTGVARALLRAACADLARRGFASVMARAAVGADVPASEQFTGPLALYLSEGFEVAGEPTHRVRVVRRLAVNGDPR
jgi:ribosomal protein S18 acetylase RimI-like enzyme